MKIPKKLYRLLFYKDIISDILARSTKDRRRKVRQIIVAYKDINDKEYRRLFEFSVNDCRKAVNMIPREIKKEKGEE